MNIINKLLSIVSLALTLNAVVCAQAAKSGDQLLEVDKAFARMSIEKNPTEAFEFYMADDIIFVPMGEKLMTDRRAIIKYFSDGIVSIAWTPMRAEVAKSNDLGYTYGVSEMKFKADDGKTVTRYYNYISVWRKNKKGAWKMIVDMGNPHPAPPVAVTAK